MTLLEAKDKVAQSWGLKDFKTLKSQGRPNLENFFDKVCELMWYESADQMKEIVRKSFPDQFSVGQINASPRPQFL